MAASSAASAIGAGISLLNLPKRPTDLAKLQAVAAVGQRRLMDAWADAFEPFKLPVAQLLLTRQHVLRPRPGLANLHKPIAAALLAGLDDVALQLVELALARVNHAPLTQERNEGRNAQLRQLLRR